MVKRSDERTYAQNKAFNGSGEMRAFKLIDTPEELYGKGRLFNHCTLLKDCEVGWHIHKGDGEFYYVLKGEGEYSDNGNIVTLKAGDVAFCPDGEGHSIINRKDEPFEMIALIIYN